jgi:hypothetical protein
MEEEIIIPLRFDNQFGPALDEAIEGVTQLNDAVAEGEEVYQDNIDAVKKYLDIVRQQAAEEAAAEKKVIAVKKTKLDAVKKLASEYGGPLGKALNATIDSYDKVSKAVKATVKQLLDKQFTIGQTERVTLTYGEALGALVKGLGAQFPKAVKAFQLGAKAIRIALISTGIGAIVVLVGALIGAFIGLGNAASDSTKGLSRVEQITIALKSTWEALVITFKGALNEIKSLINGTQSLFTTLKNIIGLSGEVAETVVKINNINTEIELLNKNTAETERNLAKNIADNTDALNKYNEAAGDTTKSTKERIEAVKAAAEIESKLESERLTIVSNRVKAQELEVSKYKEGTDDRITAELKLQDLKNDLTLVDAENSARERKNRSVINGLLEEQRQKVQALKNAYADLLKQVQEQLQGEEISLLAGEEKIRAELEVQLKAIETLRTEAEKAARAAGQSFDGAAFERLRAIANQKANLAILEENRSQAQALIELERLKQGQIAKTIAASGEENLNLQEARSILELEAQREADQKTLNSLQEFYAKRKTAITTEEQIQLEALKNAIEDNTQKEIDIRNKATERVIKEALQSRDIQREIDELELDFLTESGDKKLKLAEFVARERLRIERESLEDRLKLAIAEGKATPEEIKLLETKIKGLDLAIQKADNPFRSLKDKLQSAIKVDDKEFEAILLGLDTAVAGFSNAIRINGELAAKAQQKIIDDLTTRIDDTEAQYQRELELQRQGYANSADLYKKQLETLEAERAAAAQKAQEREKKQATIQLLIDSALQVSNYVTSVSNLLRDGTKSGLTGLIVAIGGIALLASVFAQAKANAAKFAEPPKFREGGWVDGASHAYGGKKIEVEGGEFVVSKQQAQRNAALLEAINSNSLDRFDLRKQLAIQGLNLEPLLEKMSADKEVIVSMSQGIDYQRMEQMYSRATEQMTDKVISYMKSRPIRRLAGDGNEVIEWHESGSTKRQIVKR